MVELKHKATYCSACKGALSKEETENPKLIKYDGAMKPVHYSCGEGLGADWKESDEYKKLVWDVFGYHLDKEPMFGGYKLKINWDIASDDAIKHVNQVIENSLLQDPEKSQSITMLGIQNIFLDGMPESIAKLENLKRLYLNRDGITSVPSWLFTMPKLTILNLDYNKIESLPNLPETSNLRFLSLGHNKIKNMNGIWNNMPNLISLSLEFNELAELPKSMGKLHLLKVLIISSNKNLKKLPNSVANLAKNHLETLLVDSDIEHSSRLVKDVDSIAPKTALLFFRKGKLVNMKYSVEDRVDVLKQSVWKGTKYLGFPKFLKNPENIEFGLLLGFGIASFVGILWILSLV